MGKISGLLSGKPVDKLLTQEMLAKENRRKIVKLFGEIGKSVFAANREIIHERIPNLDRTLFMKFAIRVANARADYLILALDIIDDDKRGSADDIENLAKARRTYEELLQAFEATERLIERGYSDVG